MVRPAAHQVWRVRGRKAPLPSNRDRDGKKTAAEAFRAGESTRFDDAILPVFSQTCQTNEFA
jgi:hypothetical protein